MPHGAQDANTYDTNLRPDTNAFLITLHDGGIAANFILMVTDVTDETNMEYGEATNAADSDDKNSGEEEGIEKRENYQNQAESQETQHINHGKRGAEDENETQKANELTPKRGRSVSSSGSEEERQPKKIKRQGSLSDSTTF